MRAIACAVTALLLVAGCISPAEEADTPQPMATDAAVDEGTGGLDIQVTDDEIAPLVGVQVGLVGTERQGTTDTTGRVTFSNLEPRRYVVIASRLGYVDGQKATDVTPGEVSTVSIVLDRIPIAEPRFDDVYKWDDRLPVADACAERDSGQWLEQTRGITWQKYTFQVNATKPDGTDLLAIRMDIVLKHKPADATIDIDMRLYDDAGNRLGTGGTTAADERIDLKRIMKPGTYHVFVCYWAGAQAEYRLTSTITYEQGDQAAYLRKNSREIEYPDDP